MKNTDYIIENTLLKTKIRTGTEITITFAAWLLWIYLFMPLLTLFLWLLGIRFVLMEYFKLSTIEGLVNVIVLYSVIIAFLWIIFEVWSIYNWWLFAGKDRRRKNEVVQDEELCEYFGISQKKLTAMRSSTNICIDFDENNKLNVNCGR